MMNSVIKTLLLCAVLIMIALSLNGCQRDAEVASYNLSKAADNFEITRRVIFYNGINGDYILSMEGRCSVDPHTTYLAVTCKVAADEYKKHFLGLSDNVTWFAEQMHTADVSVFHYHVDFKPQTILPDLRLRTSLNTEE